MKEKPKTMAGTQFFNHQPLQPKFNSNNFSRILFFLNATVVLYTSNNSEIDGPVESNSRICFSIRSCNSGLSMKICLTASRP